MPFILTQLWNAGTVTALGSGLVLSDTTLAATGGGGGALQTAAVSLTAAQINSNTPIEIISAPGAGKIIVPVITVYSSVFGTTRYSGGPGGIYWNFTLGDLADGGDSSVMTQGASVTNISTGAYNGVASAVANNAAVSYCSSYAGGDGTLNLTVFYVVATL
jgi:hypothetical protein